MSGDDALLASFVAGEIQDSDPRMAELAARRPEELRAARELVAVRLRLEAEREAERETLAEARAETTDADRAKVRRALSKADASGGGRALRWRSFGLVAAAAAILASVPLLLRDEAPSSNDGRFLSGGAPMACALVEPARLAAGEALRFDAAPLAPHERFVVELRMPAEGQAGTLLASHRCATPAWTPRASDLANLPDVVGVEIVRVALDAGGKELERSRRWPLPVSR